MVRVGKSDPGSGTAGDDDGPAVASGGSGVRPGTDGDGGESAHEIKVHDAATARTRNDLVRTDRRITRQESRGLDVPPGPRWH
jgi:hypothetical protein